MWSTNQGWLSSAQETGTACLVGRCSKSVPDEGSILLGIVRICRHCWSSATGLLTLPFCQDPLIICHHRMLHLLHAESTLWLLSQFLVQWNGKRYIGLVSSSSPKGNLLDGQSKTRLHDMVFHIEGWLTMLQCRQSVCLEKNCLFWTLPVSRDNMISLNYKCIRGESHEDLSCVVSYWVLFAWVKFCFSEDSLSGKKCLSCLGSKGGGDSVFHLDPTEKSYNISSSVVFSNHRAAITLDFLLTQQKFLPTTKKILVSPKHFSWP